MRYADEAQSPHEIIARYSQLVHGSPLPENGTAQTVLQQLERSGYVVIRKRNASAEAIGEMSQLSKWASATKRELRALKKAKDSSRKDERHRTGSAAECAVLRDGALINEVQTQSQGEVAAFAPIKDIVKNEPDDISEAYQRPELENLNSIYADDTVGSNEVLCLANVLSEDLRHIFLDIYYASSGELQNLQKAMLEIIEIQRTLDSKSQCETGSWWVDFQEIDPLDPG